MKTTRLLVVSACLLLALAALAQSVTRGNFVRKPEYRTSSDMTLFVNGAVGSDSNSCTSGDAGACATLQGAWSRVPYIIANNVTIAIQAGNLDAGSVFLSDRQMLTTVTGSNTAISPTITIRGDGWTNASLDGGSNTGTATSFVAPSGQSVPPVVGTISDTGQSWANDSLKGYFYVITSGADTGRSAVIVGNTATGVNVTVNFSSNVVGQTYAIQVPATNVFGRLTVSNITGEQNVLGATGGVRIQTMNLIGTLPLSVTQCSPSSALGCVLLQSSRILATSTGILMSHGGSVWLGGLSSGAPGSTNYIAAVGAGITVGNGSYLEMNGAYIRMTGASAIAVSMADQNSFAEYSRINAFGGSTTTPIIDLEGTNSTGYSVAGAAFLLQGGLVRCTSTGGTGFTLVGSPPSNSTGQLFGNASIYALGINNCATGINVSRGGRLNINRPSIVGATTDINIDGTGYALSDFNALATKTIMSPFGTFLYTE